MAWFLRLLSIGIITVVAVVIGTQMFLQTKVKLSEGIVIDVPRGQSLYKLMDQLAEKGVVRSPRLLARVGRIYGYGKKIKYGEYWLTPQDSYKTLLNKIISGDNYKYKVTFIEGDHIYTYADRLEQIGLVQAQDFLEMARNQDFIVSLLGESLESLEGYLFPDTYSFSKTDDLETIFKTMVRRFLKETQDIDFDKQDYARHQLVTLASIIEKETGAPFERAMISSVFHNRLKQGMKLQTDPTIIYGILDQTGTEVNNIRKKDILAPTRYNTYVIKGLPPGPIANPGIESLRAALNPASTEYLFFVSRNDGTHVFSRTYKEHQKAVSKYQLDPKMREGKSWRDLNRREGEK